MPRGTRTGRRAGETAKLRTLALPYSALFPHYHLDSSRVDVKLARELYDNTNDHYKLGAGFARPIIDTCAGFMGAPHFSHADPAASVALEQVAEAWTSRFFRLQRNTLRDGDHFARIVHTASKLNPSERVFELRLIPPEWVTPTVDPLTGAWQEVRIAYPVKVTRPDGTIEAQYTVYEVLRPRERIVEASSDAPASVRSQQNRREDNVWGLIPVVHFRNEPEEHRLYGSSDLEPVEPYMKAYHDTMLAAVAGARLFGNPRLLFSLRDVDRFLRRNFSPEEVESRRLRFDNKQVFLMEEGDKADILGTSQGLEHITTVLEYLFYNIVDVSETPEFAFGTAVRSSKASVSEQMIPFARKIRRKRGMFEEPYAELAGIFLAMRAKVEPGAALDTYRVSVGWDEISPKDDKAVAETINTLVQGLVTAIEAGLLSQQSAAEFLREFVPSMLPWVDEDADDDERRRVAATFAFRRRLEDFSGQELTEATEEAALPAA